VTTYQKVASPLISDKRRSNQQAAAVLCLIRSDRSLQRCIRHRWSRKFSRLFDDWVPNRLIFDAGPRCHLAAEPSLALRDRFGGSVRREKIQARPHLCHL
jgi:hypothetical protein